MQVNLKQKYVKDILARQCARPMRFDKFHGLSLNLIVKYVTPDILPNNAPLFVPLLPRRAHGCLAVVVSVPLLVSLIIYVPLFVASPFLPLIGKNESVITTVITSVT